MPEVFVHGTDYKTGLRILEKGLLPRSQSKRKAAYGTHFAKSLEDRVYLYANVGSAALAAYQVTTHKSKETDLKAVILKITIPDETLLVPDEDANAPNWIESLWTLGSVAYSGAIPPDYIEPMLQLDIKGFHKKLWNKPKSFFKPDKWLPWD